MPSDIKELIKTSLDAIFNRDQFGISQKFLALGEKYNVRDVETNEDLLWVERDKFGRYTHMHVYTDKTKSQKILHLEDKAMLDFFGKFTVMDVETNQPLASLKRKWFWSWLWRESYDIFGPEGFESQPIGKVEARGGFIRQWLRKVYKFWFLRLQFDVFLFKDGQKVKVMEYNRKATLRDNYIIDCTFDTEGQLDRRLAVALGLVLDAFEQR
ncbi:MAG: hypothetical protein ACXAB4_04685 [Candidatus Hodarchaeales archaeon]